MPDPSTTDLRANVADYYGNVLTQSEDLATNACCATGAPSDRIQKALANVHDDVTARFYGCGFPIPEAVEGRAVLDLGCGTGRDVYLLAQFVGEQGSVHGVDMTDSQLEVANATVEWHRERFGYKTANTHFHKGFIEDLSFIEDASIDIVISNCVVNLSPRKDLVMAEIHRVLKPGGEFHFSDVFVDRRLPADIANDPLLHAECLGGAMVGFDFEQLAKRTGFGDPRAIETAPITISNEKIEAMVGDARFVSTTLRMFKLDDLEPRAEDFGHTATYVNAIPDVGNVFTFDENNVFALGQTVRVSSNTARMLRETRFCENFEVNGDGTTHHGAFHADARPAPVVKKKSSCC